MRAPFLHAARGAAAFGAALLVPAALPVLSGLPVGAAPAQHPSSSIVLESQAPAFVSSQSGVTLGISVRSTRPASELALNVILDSRVLYPSNLQQDFAGSLSGLSPLPQGQGYVPLSSVHWVSGQTVDLHLPISAPDLPTTRGKSSTGTDGVDLSLACEPPNCGGVYPLQVALFNSVSGEPIQSFTTYLIVTPPSETAGTKPLNFAWTIPLGTALAITPAGTTTVDSQDIAELNSLQAVLAGAPGAAVSVDLFPQFVEALVDRSDRADTRALVTLHRLAATSRVAIIPGTFVPVDLDALTGSGLPSGVASQLQRSSSVLADEFPVAGGHTYVANAPISSRALGELSGQGITRVLLPSDGAAPLTPPYSGYTPTTPFLIPNAGVEGIASDPGLESDLNLPGTAALQAQQLLANLAIVYFDNPQAKQALALDTPLDYTLRQGLMTDLLDGLSGSPVVRAVTLPSAFDAVAAGSSPLSPQTRGLAQTKPTPPDQQISAAAVTTAEASLAAYYSMMPTAPRSSDRPPLSDLILVSEAIDLSPSERSAYLSTVNDKATSVAQYLSLPFKRLITVTSLRATVPISIISTSRMPIIAELTVGGLDLGFPRGHVYLLTLLPRTNVVKITLTTRTAGTFSMSLTLSARTGYVIQSGAITIQSTAISGVAVALSAGAGLFLIVWWLRSIVSKRRKRHKARGAALAASALPAAASAEPGDLSE